MIGMPVTVVLDDAQAASLLRLGPSQVTPQLGTYVQAVNEIIGVEVGAALAGLTEIPAGVTLAASIILRHMWQADQQGPRANFGGTDQDVVRSPQGFLIPNRAWLLLAPYHAPLGFA